MSDSEEDDIFKKKKPAKQKQKEQQQNPTIKPKNILYCPICTLPIEYCEYNKNARPCLEWLNKTHPDLYTQLYKDLKLDIPQQQQQQQQQQDVIVPPKKTKKVKVKESDMVYIKVKQRQKNKYITIITGLEKHFIDLKEAQKKFSKKFGCGAHIQDNALELQGDLSVEIEEQLPKEYPQIKEEMIEIKEK